MASSTFLEYQIDFKDTERWQSYLSTQGFVVITRVMPQPKEAVAEFIKDFGTEDHFGFIDDRNFPYSRFAWMCRAHPQVLEVYRTLYGLFSCSELITAIDRGSAISNNVNTSEDATEQWLHVDYPIAEGLATGPVYQSFLSLVDQDTSRGPPAGLRVVPMGDEELTQHHTRISNGEKTFWMLSDAHNLELKPRMVPVVSPAGSLTLWKCGLIHDNTTVVYPNAGGEPLARLVVYLCYTPKYWATEEEITRRQRIFRLQHTTTHWPAVYLSTHYAGMRKKALLVDQEKILEDYPVISSLVPLF
jgi:hypothetical protein